MFGKLAAMRSPPMLEQQLVLIFATVTGVIVGFSLSLLSPSSSFQAASPSEGSCRHTSPFLVPTLPAVQQHAPTLPPAADPETASCVPGVWVKYGNYTGPCDVCGLARDAVESILALPHECQMHAYWDGQWQKIRKLRQQPKGPATCLILCAKYVRCKSPPCVLGFLARPGGSDGVVVREVFFQGVFTKSISLPPAQKILDAGANVGTVSVFLSLTYPNATIVSVEASKTNYEMLRKNTRAFPNVKIVHAALWSTVTNLCLFDSGSSRVKGLTEWGYRVYPCNLIPRSYRVMERMQGMTIPVLARMLDLPHFDILKIDIEGAEGTVFHPRADTSFLRHGDLVIMEVHQQLWKGCLKVVNKAFDRTNRWLPSKKIGEHHVWVANHSANATVATGVLENESVDSGSNSTQNATSPALGGV